MERYGRALLYTLVFSIYCVLLSVILFWVSESLFPGQLLAKDELSEELILRIGLVFSGIVFFSFYGASYVVYGRLREGDDGRRMRSRRGAPRRSSSAPSAQSGASPRRRPSDRPATLQRPHSARRASAHKPERSRRPVSPSDQDSGLLGRVPRRRP